MANSPLSSRRGWFIGSSMIGRKKNGVICYLGAVAGTAGAGWRRIRGVANRVGVSGPPTCCTTGASARPTVKAERERAAQFDTVGDRVEIV